MSIPRLRIFGALGLSGVVFFLLSILALQARPDVDLTTHFVSDFVNGPGGWLFVVATMIHGFGNIGLSLGLRQSLRAGKWSGWASGLLFAAAAGMLVIAIFPTDPTGSSRTLVGYVHGAAVAGSFVLELAALFLFALACGQGSLWKPLARHCLAFAILAAVGLSLFFFLLLIEQLQGLGERAALLSFMVWEIWVSIGLIRLGRRTSEHVHHRGRGLSDHQHPNAREEQR